MDSRLNTSGMTNKEICKRLSITSIFGKSASCDRALCVSHVMERFEVLFRRKNAYKNHINIYKCCFNGGIHL
ncbi:MAG: hypothetical protein HW415_64 [Deltaproteobacteria bacterium]|nr:hypothetical protein [Deltaproteobacteria bacterium]